jgi:hypothetical protein
MKEAHLPRIKTLEQFDFAQSPHIPAARSSPAFANATAPKLFGAYCSWKFTAAINP